MQFENQCPEKLISNYTELSAIWSEVICLRFFCFFFKLKRSRSILKTWHDFKQIFNRFELSISNGLKFTADHVLSRDSGRVRLCAAQFSEFQKIGKIPYNSEKYAEIVIINTRHCY